MNQAIYHAASTVLLVLSLVARWLALKRQAQLPPSATNRQYPFLNAWPTFSRRRSGSV
jgi:hypothetical protein